jgi:hypothetical protein
MNALSFLGLLTGLYLMVAYVDCSIVFTSNQTLATVSTVYVGAAQDAPSNITARYCFTSDNPCEPLYNTTCDITQPLILIVQIPNCQQSTMRSNIETSSICNTAKTTCVPSSSVLMAIVFFDPTGQALGYNSLTLWSEHSGEYSLPLFAMTLNSSIALRPLSRFRPWLTLVPDTNEWITYYDSPEFLAGVIVSAIFSGIVLVAMFYSMGKYVFVDRKTAEIVPVVKLVYLSIEILANVLRLVCIVGAMSSGSWFYWPVQQFFISLNPGLTLIGALLVPVHIFPMLTKRIIPSKKVKNTVLSLYLTISGCLIAFIIIRPASTIAFVDEDVRAWGGWLVFVGYLFIAFCYNLFCVLVIIRIRRRNRRQTKIEGNSGASEALKRIGVLLAVTTGLFYIFCSFSIEAIVLRSFLRPRALAITTFVQFNLLTAISLVQQFHFRSSIVRATSTGSSDKFSTTGRVSMSNIPASIEATASM